jgi:hypothetical protein
VTLELTEDEKNANDLADAQTMKSVIDTLYNYKETLTQLDAEGTFDEADFSPKSLTAAAMYEEVPGLKWDQALRSVILSRLKKDKRIQVANRALPVGGAKEKWESGDEDNDDDAGAPSTPVGGGAAAERGGGAAAKMAPAKKTKRNEPNIYELTTQELIMQSLHLRTTAHYSHTVEVKGKITIKRMKSASAIDVIRTILGPPQNTYAHQGKIDHLKATLGKMTANHGYNSRCPVFIVLLRGESNREAVDGVLFHPIPAETITNTIDSLLDAYTKKTPSVVAPSVRIAVSTAAELLEAMRRATASERGVAATKLADIAGSALEEELRGKCGPYSEAEAEAYKKFIRRAATPLIYTGLFEQWPAHQVKDKAAKADPRTPLRLERNTATTSRWINKSSPQMEKNRSDKLITYLINVLEQFELQSDNIFLTNDDNDDPGSTDACELLCDRDEGVAKAFQEAQTTEEGDRPIDYTSPDIPPNMSDDETREWIDERREIRYRVACIMQHLKKRYRHKVMVDTIDLHETEGGAKADKVDNNKYDKAHLAQAAVAELEARSSDLQKLGHAARPTGNTLVCRRCLRHEEVPKEIAERMAKDREALEVDNLYTIGVNGKSDRNIMCCTTRAPANSFGDPKVYESDLGLTNCYNAVCAECWAKYESSTWNPMTQQAVVIDNKLVDEAVVNPQDLDDLLGPDTTYESNLFRQPQLVEFYEADPMAPPTGPKQNYMCPLCAFSAVQQFMKPAAAEKKHLELFPQVEVVRDGFWEPKAEMPKAVADVVKMLNALCVAPNRSDNDDTDDDDDGGEYEDEKEDALLVTPIGSAYTDSHQSRKLDQFKFDDEMAEFFVRDGECAEGDVMVAGAFRGKQVPESEMLKRRADMTLYNRAGPTDPNAPVEAAPLQTQIDFDLKEAPRSARHKELVLAMGQITAAALIMGEYRSLLAQVRDDPETDEDEAKEEGSAGEAPSGAKDAVLASRIVTRPDTTANVLPAVKETLTVLWQGGDAHKGPFEAFNKPGQAVQAAQSVSSHASSLLHNASSAGKKERESKKQKALENTDRRSKSPEISASLEIAASPSDSQEVGEAEEEEEEGEATQSIEAFAAEQERQWEADEPDSQEVYAMLVEDEPTAKGLKKSKKEIERLRVEAAHKKEAADTLQGKIADNETKAKAMDKEAQKLKEQLQDKLAEISKAKEDVNNQRKEAGEKLKEANTLAEDADKRTKARAKQKQKLVKKKQQEKQEAEQKRDLAKLQKRQQESDDRKEKARLKLVQEQENNRKKEEEEGDKAARNEPKKLDAKLEKKKKKTKKTTAAATPKSGAMKPKAATEQKSRKTPLQSQAKRAKVDITKMTRVELKLYQIQLEKDMVEAQLQALAEADGDEDEDPGDDAMLLNSSPGDKRQSNSQDEHNLINHAKIPRVGGDKSVKGAGASEEDSSQEGSDEDSDEASDIDGSETVSSDDDDDEDDETDDADESVAAAAEATPKAEAVAPSKANGDSSDSDSSEDDNADKRSVEASDKKGENSRVGNGRQRVSRAIESGSDSGSSQAAKKDETGEKKRRRTIVSAELVNSSDSDSQPAEEDAGSFADELVSDEAKEAKAKEKRAEVYKRDVANLKHIETVVVTAVQNEIWPDPSGMSPPSDSYYDPGELVQIVRDELNDHSITVQQMNYILLKQENEALIPWIESTNTTYAGKTVPMFRYKHRTPTFEERANLIKMPPDEPASPTKKAGKEPMAASHKATLTAVKKMMIERAEASPVKISAAERKAKAEAKKLAVAKAATKAKEMEVLDPTRTTIAAEVELWRAMRHWIRAKVKEGRNAPYSIEDFRTERPNLCFGRTLLEVVQEVVKDKNCSTQTSYGPFEAWVSLKTDEGFLDNILDQVMASIETKCTANPKKQMKFTKYRLEASKLFPPGLDLEIKQNVAARAFKRFGEATAYNTLRIKHSSVLVVGKKTEEPQIEFKLASQNPPKQQKKKTTAKATAKATASASASAAPEANDDSSDDNL